VALRSRIQQIEKAARGSMDWFILSDGSRYFFDPQTMPGTLFDHGSDCLKADFKREIRPSPPEILVAVTKARDRKTALEKLWLNLFPYDSEALIERGVLEHRSFIAGEEWVAP
jgi:hypothetical protein